MSHLSAEACTQRLAAGRGNGYRLAAATATAESGTGSGPACYKLATAGSYAAHSEMLPTEKGRRKGTGSAQV